MDRLAGAHVMVVGVGGVGSWAVEALARSGVGTLSMVDLDDVCITNTNRQIPATTSTVGRPKVEVLRDRVLDIAPSCAVHPHAMFYDDATAASLLDGRPDWVIDAIDSLDAKAHLIAACAERGLRVVVSGGAGGRVDATRVRLGTLDATGGDGLLRATRRRLRDVAPWLHFRGVAAVYSDERQRFPGVDGEVCAARDAASALRLDCASGFGAVSFVTGTFGLFAASHVVSSIAAAA